MRQIRNVKFLALGSAFGLTLLALIASPGCNQDLAQSENSSPVVLPDSEEGKKALANAGAFVKLREEQEAKSRARAARRKKGFPEDEQAEAEAKAKSEAEAEAKAKAHD